MTDTTFISVGAGAEAAAFKALARERAALRARFDAAKGEEYLGLSVLIRYDEDGLTFRFVGILREGYSFQAIFAKRWPEHESSFRYVPMIPDDFFPD